MLDSLIHLHSDFVRATNFHNITLTNSGCWEKIFVVLRDWNLHCKQTNAAPLNLKISADIPCHSLVILRHAVTELLNYLPALTHFYAVFNCTFKKSGSDNRRHIRRVCETVPDAVAQSCHLA